MLTIDENNTNIVRKSNELIEARYTLSLSEQRLILLLCSQIELQDEDFKDYEIRVKDFAKLFGLETDKSLYEKIENTVNELVGKRIFLKNGNIKEVTTWLSYAIYEQGSGKWFDKTKV